MKNVKEDHYIDKLNFNLSGDSFATEGRGIGVWDYTKGKLKAFYDLEQETNSLTWLSDREYIVLSKSIKYSTGSEDNDLKRIKIYRDIVSDNGDVERILEDNLQEDIVKKRNGLDHKNLVLQVRATTPYAVVSLSGKPHTGILDHQGYVDFWNIRENKKVASYQGYNKIISAEYNLLENNIVIFERRRDEKVEVKIFDVDKRKINKKIIVPGSENISNIKIVKKSDKFILYGKSGRQSSVIVLEV